MADKSSKWDTRTEPIRRSGSSSIELPCNTQENPRNSVTGNRRTTTGRYRRIKKCFLWYLQSWSIYMMLAYPKPAAWILSYNLDSQTISFSQDIPQLLKNWPKCRRFFRIKKCTSLDICSLDSRVVAFRMITMCGGENMGHTWTRKAMSTTNDVITPNTSPSTPLATVDDPISISTCPNSIPINSWTSLSSFLNMWTLWELLHLEITCLQWQSETQIPQDTLALDGKCNLQLCQEYKELSPHSASQSTTPEERYRQQC